MIDISLGIKAVWTIAGIEATEGRFKEIEPEHFFIAILKIVDLVDNLPYYFYELNKDDNDAMIEEITPVKLVLEEQGISAKELRRGLRQSLGVGDADYKERMLHRSDKSRKVFENLSKMSNTTTADIKALMLTIMAEKPHAIMELMVNEDIDVNKLYAALISVSADNPEEIIAKEAQEKHKVKKKVLSPDIIRKTPTLNKLGRDLTLLAYKNKLSKVIGRSNEIKELGRILIQSRKPNAILIGYAGVGKTAVVEGLANYIVEGKVPEPLMNKRIIEISIGNLVAGTTFRGELEERVKKVIEEASYDEVILFIDELHNMMGAGRGGDSLDISNMMKPALSRGEISLIGATTIDEYRKYIEKDSAIIRRLQTLFIDEPSRDDVIEILKELRHFFINNYNVDITDEALMKAVDLSIKYLPDLRLPDKAIDILEYACAKKVFPSQYSLSDKIPQKSVMIDDVLSAVSKKANIPLENLSDEETDRLLMMEDYLKRRVIGQNEAVELISKAVRVSKAGLKKADKPIGVFLFLGPTGVGKTELAKALAEFMFHSEDKLIRFDMSEYMEKHQVSRLIGAPPGYIGHENEGELISKVRTNPHSVVLFDEIEKAHPDIRNIFLQIFDNGILTSSKGKKVHFSETIIIMTSNIGSNIINKGTPKEKKRNIGFNIPSRSFRKSDLDDNEDKNKVIALLKSKFSPELLNRIQHTIVFNSLDKETVRGILDKIIRDIQIMLNEKSITIELDEASKDYLIDKGYNIEYGGRYLERVVQQELVIPLSELIIEKSISNKKIVIRLNNGKLNFEVS
jgi:ATP-dependent Clp protease ATP-binding subunit ClpC